MSSKGSGDGGRSRIIQAAREFFVQKGFHQTAMGELSERASISVGQIYRLFENKSQIIVAIIEEDMDRRVAALEAILRSIKDGLIPIHVGLEQVVACALGDAYKALNFEILAEAFRNIAAAGVISRTCERYRILLRQLAQCANPRLEGDRLAGAEEILLACLFGLGNRSFSKPTTSFERTVKLTADFLFAALQ